MGKQRLCISSEGDWTTSLKDMLCTKKIKGTQGNREEESNVCSNIYDPKERSNHRDQNVYKRKHTEGMDGLRTQI